MMIGIAEVCRLVGGIETVELERWISETWVLPESSGGTFVFQEVDVARIRLIIELRRDFAIGDDAVPVVLHLLDQLYATRRRLKALSAAFDALPPELREAVAARIGERDP
jgi:chaperone modulatory protein CbpM